MTAYRILLSFKLWKVLKSTATWKGKDDAVDADLAYSL